MSLQRPIRILHFNFHDDTKNFFDEILYADFVTCPTSDNSGKYYVIKSRLSSNNVTLTLEEYQKLILEYTKIEVNETKKESYLTANQAAKLSMESNTPKQVYAILNEHLLESVLDRIKNAALKGQTTTSLASFDDDGNCVRGIQMYLSSPVLFKLKDKLHELGYVVFQKPEHPNDNTWYVSWN